jgi:hypothetical protein
VVKIINRVAAFAQERSDKPIRGAAGRDDNFSRIGYRGIML